MPRTASAIQAEIDVLEAHLASANSVVGSSGSDGTSLTYAQRSAMEARLDRLYQMMDRATGKSPMFVRSRVGGLRDGRA